MDKAEDGIQPKQECVDEENQKEGEGSECGLEYGDDGKELLLMMGDIAKTRTQDTNESKCLGEEPCGASAH